MVWLNLHQVLSCWFEVRGSLTHGVERELFSAIPSPSSWDRVDFPLVTGAREPSLSPSVGWKACGWCEHSDQGCGGRLQEASGSCVVWPAALVLETAVAASRGSTAVVLVIATSTSCRNPVGKEGHAFHSCRKPWPCVKLYLPFLPQSGLESRGVPEGGATGHDDFMDG